jgi:hypothetical protein
MTSIRQIEANRRNASRSTGPRTEEGKRSSRANAYRHGLTAETVVARVEDQEDYQAFEAAVIADYDVRTALERELVLRLASLLWRLRRVTAVETDLLSIQAESLAERRQGQDAPQQCDSSSRAMVYLLPLRAVGRKNEPVSADVSSPSNDETNYAAATRTLSYCFLRLANLESAVFDRLNRYEAGLWRQTLQTLFFLRQVRRPPPV